MVAASVAGIETMRAGAGQLALTAVTQEHERRSVLAVADCAKSKGRDGSRGRGGQTCCKGEMKNDKHSRIPTQSHRAQ